MNVCGVSGKMSQTEWDISSIYCTATFKKVGTQRVGTSATSINLSDKEFAIGLMKLRKVYGAEKVNQMGREEKVRLIKDL